MSVLRILLPTILVAGAAFAQPTVSSVVNGASNILPGLPNAGIAQGAIFVIYGSGLGPAALVQAPSYPLQTTLSGTSVKVTVSGTSVDAIMVYTLATQVAAILPSRTPVGTGTLAVTYSGRTGATFPITVVQSNVGLVSLNSRGTGDAVATLADNSVVGPANAPNPGETVVFWATGLGPVTYDETVAPLGGDMTNVALEVLVGGKAAGVLYRGRTGCCAGTDQINVTLPQDVAGCAVPVVMKIGNLVSNTVTIPIAASGRQCTPSNPALSQSDYARVLAAGSYTAGGVSLSRQTTTSTSGIPGFSTTTTTKSDTASASFMKVTGNLAAVFNSQYEYPAIGSCTVYTFAGQSYNPMAGLTYQSLDAGAVSVSGPNGTRTLNRSESGGLLSYSLTLGNATPGNYLDQGTYTTTGTGGPGVGAFTAQHTLPPELVWTNQSAITSVNRATGVTINWTGGDPSGHVQIQGMSFSGASVESAVTAMFTCIAKSTDRTFTVPSWVLLALPASPTVSAGGFSMTIPGTLSVSAASSTAARLQGSGLDFSYFSSQVGVSIGVPYQ